MPTKNQVIIVPEAIRHICSQLWHQGYQAFVVGGAVRDGLLGLKPTDWDLATDALPETVSKIFPHTIPSGQRFGTITVVNQGFLTDVTTMRQDAHYSDRRRPDHVEFCTDIVQDLARRDFTINALAYNPLTNELVDPYRGVSDLRRKIIRTVGDGKIRFAEDALRMLRLIRFCAVLNFRPHRQTVKAIQPKLIRAIAAERIKDELSKLLLAANILQPLKLMFSTGIMDEILPELAATAGVTQGSYHRWDVLGHLIMAAQAGIPKLEIRLAALLHDIGKTQTRTRDRTGIHFYGHDQAGAKMVKPILNRLTFSKSIQDKVALLVEHHMYQIHPHSTDKAIRKLIAKVGPDNIYDLLELRKADILAMRFNPRQTLSYYQQMKDRISHILDAEQALTRKDLAVTGRDLIDKLQLDPGPLVGQVLSHLVDVVLEQPEANEHAELLRRAAQYLEQTYRL